MTGDNLLGIAGLTPGGIGIWIGLIGLGAWWIRGMADRRRAANEGLAVESKATDAVVDLLRAEVARMSTRMGQLEKRVDELELEKRAVIAERDAALADNARLRAINLGQGQVRQDAAAIVAIERAQDRKAGS